MNIGATLQGWVNRAIGLLGNSSKFWAAWAGGGAASGEPVTAERAMTLSAFNRGVRLYAETVATLPIDVFKIGRDGRGALVTDPADQYRNVLKISPNQDQTPVEYWEGMVGCMFLTGDGLARKIKIGNRLVALELMDPTRATCLRKAGVPGRIWRYIDPYGKILELADDDVFQLKGFGFGGDRGMSIVQFGAQAIGSSLAADKVAAKMFKSGLSSSGFLETNQVINEGDRPRLEQVLAEYQGSDNAGKIMILEAGMKYTAVSLSAADAQLLQARGFNIEEIARWLGLPPVLLGHSGAGSTMWGTGVEQIIQAWYNLGLRALLHRIEQAIAKRVFSAADQGRYYVKFNVDGLLRGDSAARANFYSIMVQNGIMTRAEVRELEDLEPVDGADKLTAQINLTTLDKIGEEAPAGGQAPEALMREKIRNWLGLDGGVTPQDLFDIRAAIADLKRSRAEPVVIDQPRPAQIPPPAPAPRDR